MTLADLIRVAESFTLSGVQLDTPIRVNMDDGPDSNYNLIAPTQDAAKFYSDAIIFGVDWTSGPQE